jgi:hypothetical protein
MKKVSVLGGAVGAGLLTLASSAHAVGLDVSGVALDTAPVFTVAALVFTALGSLWAIRKVIKTINKS